MNSTYELYHDHLKFKFKFKSNKKFNWMTKPKNFYSWFFIFAS